MHQLPQLDKIQDIFRVRSFIVWLKLPLTKIAVELLKIFPNSDRNFGSIFVATYLRYPNAQYKELFMIFFTISFNQVLSVLLRRSSWT